MRLHLILMLAVALLSISLGVTINIGKLSVEATEVNYNTIVEILQLYTSQLSLQKISLGEVGTFKYVEWNDHLLAVSNDVFVFDGAVVKEIDFQKIFDFFEIKYLKEGDNINLVTMYIEKLTDYSNLIQIDYLGKNNLETFLNNNTLYIKTDGYTYMNRLYVPGEVVYTHKYENANSFEENFLPNRTIIQIYTNWEVKKYVFKSLGDTITNLDSDSFVVFYVNSTMNAVFVRNYSPDFGGSDWERYAFSKNVAENLATKFKFKLFYVPFIQLPIENPGIVIYGPEETWEEVKKYLKGD
ncbi:DUF4941 domain-containing protein [Thermosipho ferrireducens]|uniref:DUF4941 domain-containing protein n=1 Tax=Thermosipho ferrireducens TaxID=2571116 RepID=A0ABX7S6Y4_9BACT|nr:DUF4941 domain-containing protein [Thermosipho ferrireducens]QTA37611.1 DUF4941 domain-containing protein [Thermosipho ferrireducens]